MWLEARKLTKPYQETVDRWPHDDNDDDDGNSRNKNDR